MQERKTTLAVQQKELEASGKKIGAGWKRKTGKSRDEEKQHFDRQV